MAQTLLGPESLSSYDVHTVETTRLQLRLEAIKPTVWFLATCGDHPNRVSM